MMMCGEKAACHEHTLTNMPQTSVPIATKQTRLAPTPLHRIAWWHMWSTSNAGVWCYIPILHLPEPFSGECENTTFAVQVPVSTQTTQSGTAAGLYGLHCYGSNCNNMLACHKGCSYKTHNCRHRPCSTRAANRVVTAWQQGPQTLGQM